MLVPIILLATLSAVTLASPIAKQITHYENTILHQGPSPKLHHNISVPVPRKPDKISFLDEINSYPEYEFSYGVKDPKTGDRKDHWEKRVGDRVLGMYMFVEADGTQRLVEYEADDKNGFRAKVTKVVGNPKLEGISRRGSHDSSSVAAISYNMLRKAN